METAGWKKTFDGYYEEEVGKILTAVLQALGERDNRKFIWSEVSYFEVWYENLTSIDQDQFKAFVEQRRFEFVGSSFSSLFRV